MKYFKVTKINNPDEEFYVSSTLPNETSMSLALSLHLDDSRYKIEEVLKDEFDRETDDEDSLLDGLSFRKDLDYEDDLDLADDDDPVDCFCD